MNREWTKVQKIAIPLVVTVVAGLIYFYFVLPPLNPKSMDFWTFLLFLFAVYLVIALLMDGLRITNGSIDMPDGALRRCSIPLGGVIAVVAVMILGSVFSITALHAKSYYNLLDVQTGDFTEEVAEISYDKIPMLDSDSSIQIGSRALGSISSANSAWISQFEVSDTEYSQINYQSEPVRVAPLKYGNLIKWFNNRKNGLPGYIVVNMCNQEGRLIQLDEGMKYSTSDHFGRYVYRVLRFRYPTMMFGDINFEIDDDGIPWWICSRTVHKISLFGGTDTKGAVLINAITGESQYYEEVPNWVDRVYSADLLVEQYNYHGKLVNGWVNSWFSQKGITTTTSGYNYIAMNDDVYLYTGVTSAGDDQSNVGFILVNQRTKDARYYNITGATEYSAMSSAEGAVQHLNYNATFPLLLNISDEPTYFMSLKDSADLVKMYAMVNVRDYQITATGSSVAECQVNYEALLAENGINVIESYDLPDSDFDTVTGEIADVRTIVVDGNTMFYFSLGDGNWYVVSAEDDPDAVIFDVGDTVTITYLAGEGTIMEAAKVEQGEQA